MSADTYEELASEYLQVAREDAHDPSTADFAEELAAEMLALANLARRQ